MSDHKRLNKQTLKKLYTTPRYLLRQRLGTLHIPTTPNFSSEETTAWFTSQLSNTEQYLEYGSGGTTYLAGTLGVPFVTIDSDYYFLRQLKSSIERNISTNSEKLFRYADIGLTGPWGKPLTLGFVGAHRRTLFKRYSDSPPEVASGQFTPDFVLIDGRFRVAAALKTIMALEKKQSWTLAVDDFVGRSNYQVITHFAKLSKTVGAMAVFSGPTDFSKDEILSAINHYELDPR